MELAYGKFGRKLITNLMLEVEGKGNLINRVDLFTGENCEVLKKYITLKFLAKEKKININKKNTIEEEIQELEKLIYSEEIVSENNNQKKDKLIGKKIKRTTDGKSDDINSELEESQGKKKNYDKSEIENMNNDIFPKKKESKSEVDKSNINEDDYIDDATEFQKLYKEITCKYGFKKNGNILKEIKEKMKDKSIDPDELYALSFVYYYLCNVS